MIWGRDTEAITIDGNQYLAYSKRRVAMSELLIDARRWPEQDYLVSGSRRLTFQQHEYAVHRVAEKLLQAGIQQGDPVLLLAANSIEWVVSFWSILQAGGVVISGNAWWSADEIEHAIATAHPKLTIADDKRLELLPSGQQCISIKEIEVWVNSSEGWETTHCPAKNENDPAVILFTSGSTGAPKGAILSHRSQIANVHNLQFATKTLPHERTRDIPSAVQLISTPLFHIGGIQPIVSAIVSAGKIVLTEGRFDPVKILTAIQEEQVSRWAGPPTMLVRLLDYPGLNNYDHSSLRSVGLGGASIPPELAERIREHFPSLRRNVNVSFGLSEAGGTLTNARGKDYQERPTTSGKPFPNVQLRIDSPDESGIGEICAKSPTVMSGYLGTSESPIDADGWLHTGDLGYVDDDGFLHVTGRIKDIIIRGGENVAAANVEKAISCHPDVAEVAVVPLPHPDWGEEVGAAVVTNSMDRLSESVLTEFIKPKLAHFEQPTSWWIRTETLPLGDTQKINKREIVAQWPRSM